MTDQLTDAEKQEIEGLKRVLERFVMYAQVQLKANFRDHPEAMFNRNLVSETVMDMSVAAAVYENIGGKNLYQAAEMRERGTLGFTQVMLQNPQSGPPSEDDIRGLLKAAPGASQSLPDAPEYHEPPKPLPAKGEPLGPDEISRVMKFNAGLITNT